MDLHSPIEMFPHIGCGTKFVPFKKGPFMVCEIQMIGSACGWEAFLADITPTALDDQLKKISYDALSSAFWNRSRRNNDEGRCTLDTI